MVNLLSHIKLSVKSVHSYLLAVPDTPRLDVVIPHYSNASQALIKLTLRINQTVSYAQCLVHIRTLCRKYHALWRTGNCEL